MAQTIKLKRSATQGASPTTSQLELGEVAINTYDGKMYIKKNVGGTESIVEIGSGGGGSGLASSFTLYEYTATASQTTFSGSDSNSNTLAYDTGTPPKILVYLNGVLLDHSTDYTATNGTSVVLTSAAAASDLVQIAAYKSSVSTTLDIDLSDNQKLLLGDDDDLQIYHDSSTNSSIIKETGAGNLELWGNNVKIMNVAGTETQLNANPNGQVELYYDNSKKLETTNDGVTVTGDVEADEFIGDVRGAVLFKASAGEALAKGDVVYISGISGNTTVVSKADADDANKMPAFGIAAAAALANTPVDVYTSGILSGIDTSSFSEGDELFVSTTAGVLTATPPTGESAALQKIGKVTRSASSGSIFIIGAGRSNATPNLNEGKLFVGNSSNQAVADDTVHVDIANSRVGIGTTSPNDTLTVAATGGGINIQGTSAYLRWNSGDMMIKNEGSYKMGFYTYNATDVALNQRMVIDTNGNVGIGTSSISSALSGSNKTLKIEDDDGADIRFVHTGGADFTLGVTNSNTAYVWNAGSHNILFGTNSTERMRIDSSGNLLVGKTAVTLNTEGHAITPTYARFTRDSANPVQFNRTTNDGDIATFYKDGTVVGSIGTINNILTIGSGSTGIIFNPNASPNASIYPWNIGTNSASDNAIDLGISTRRWQDLYLAGTIYGGSTLTLDPSAHGDNTGTVVIAGNLQVDGTTTTINSTTLTVDDKNITLASGSINKAAANGAGLTVDCGSDTDATFIYDGTNDEWDFNKNINVTGAVVSSANGAITTASGTTARFSVSETGGATTAMDARGSTGNIGTRSNHTLGFLVNDVQKATLTANGDFSVTNDIKVTTTNPRIDFDGGNSGALRFFSTSAAQERMRITSAGNVGIGTTNPGRQLTIEGTSNAYIKTDATSHTSWTIGSDTYGFLIYDDDVGGIDGYRIVVRQSSGNVGVGTTQPQAKFQVEEAGIDTTTTSTTATTQVAIDSFQASAFRSARYTIQVTNSTDSTYHLTEVLLIHDGTTPQITEYGTIFTGSAEATFDADISSGNVRLLATPATTDSMTFKVVRHCITV